MFAVPFGMDIFSRCKIEFILFECFSNAHMHNSQLAAFVIQKKAMSHDLTMHDHQPLICEVDFFIFT